MSSPRITHNHGVNPHYRVYPVGKPPLARIAPARGQELGVPRRAMLRFMYDVGDGDVAAGRLQFTQPVIAVAAGEPVVHVVFSAGAVHDDDAVGLIVDEISEVVKISADSIEGDKDKIGEIGTEFIEGLGKTDDGILPILDVFKLIDRERKENAEI